ncbi:hypothetical protein [Dactylosporangium sp. CS-033363]|uniref:hypothetical protein n=1 Tax=Dactylosporangium sp. CS-033363 TaxID=3239935 RepID=UPI003D8A211F
MPALLAVDYGTAFTFALRRNADGTLEPVWFDGREELPSAVYENPDGTYTTGEDAVRRARIDPWRYHATPKQAPATIGQRFVTATLRRVAEAAPADRLVLTVPASWPNPRRRALADAAVAAGMPAPALLPRAVAAAAYCSRLPGREIPDGGTALVFHLGAGGGEATAVRRRDTTFEVLATEPFPLGDENLGVAAARSMLGDAREGGPGTPWFLTGRGSAEPAIARLIGGDPLVLRHPRHAVVAGALLIDEPALGTLLLGTRRTYAVGGGHITTTWRAVEATQEQLRQLYRTSLPHHTEAPPARWSHERRDGGFRRFHHVTLFPADDPEAAGLPAGRSIPDHLHTVIRDDDATLPN